MSRLALLALSLFLVCGCGKPDGDATVAKASAAKADSGPDTEASEASESAESDGIQSSLKRAFSQVSRKGRDAANGVSDMVTDLYQDATEAGAKATQETADWVTSTYEKARNAGQTSATNARDWVMEDLKRGGAWEYQVLPVQNPTEEELQKKLNELGRERWECYEVIPNGDRTTLYLKRSSRSMLRSLPVRDVMRILPLLGGGDDEPPAE